MQPLTSEHFALAEKRSAGFSYPVYVNNLLEIGVTRYEVDVATQDKKVFANSSEPLNISGHGITLTVKRSYDEKALKTALHRTQTELSDYPAFMSEIAEAGVHHYTADLRSRTVTYFGHNTKDFYQEPIPQPDKDHQQ